MSLNFGRLDSIFLNKLPFTKRLTDQKCAQIALKPGSLDAKKFADFNNVYVCPFAQKWSVIPFAFPADVDIEVICVYDHIQPEYL